MNLSTLFSRHRSASQTVLVMRRALLAPLWIVTVFFALNLSPIRAQEKADGPTSVVITYKSRAETRAAFRTYMENAGSAQFGAWKKAGMITDYQILFGSYAGGGPFDMAVLLTFSKYSDTTHWKDIEKRMPGGLSAEALKLGEPVSSSLADVISHGEAPDRNTAKAVYMVALYDLLADASKYKRYVEGYTTPQMQGWIKEGVLTGYTQFLNQNPAGAPWASMLVLEYKDMSGLALREIVKKRGREQLANDPSWKAFTKEKGEIRKETGIVIADAITSSAP